MKTKKKARRPGPRLLPQKRGPGRPPLADEDKVRRVVCYLTPRYHEALEKRATELRLDLPKYAKKALERLAQGLLGEKVEGEKP